MNKQEGLDADHKRMELEKADTASLKEIGKSAYAHWAALRRQSAPYEEDMAMVKQILAQRMLAENRVKLIDDDFDIHVEFGDPPITRNDDAIVQALQGLRIDDEPIPANDLTPAAYYFQPPTPKPEPKTNLTKLKGLVKAYGKPVQDILDKYITRGDAPFKRIVFEPKVTPE